MSECIFKCGKALGKKPLAVEMNVTRSGEFLATSNTHDGRGGVVPSERVSGEAHVDCYDKWFQEAYGVPFKEPA